MLNQGFVVKEDLIKPDRIINHAKTQFEHLRDPRMRNSLAVRGNNFKEEFKMPKRDLTLKSSN